MTDRNQPSRTETLQDELTKRGRDVWLAGLGALATVEEEGTKLFNRLVDRGKEFEEERKDELESASEKAREQRDEALAQIEEAGEETRTLLTDTISAALERFGVPSRTEFEQLSDKVDALSQQVENLTETLSEQSTSPSSDEK